MKCKRCGAVLPSGEAICEDCGSVLPELEGTGLPSGTVLAGKYELVGQIGAGGMGRIYRAVQSPLGVEVCVKTLHQRATVDPQFAARFEREARTTSQIRHPNVVSVYDFGTHTDGSMYLVMEYIQGTSLARLTKKGRPLPAERAVAILAQLCDALSAAHALGVIHRDLKPANIMVVDLADKADHVKVLDFGSALMMESQGGERLTQMGTVIGTPAYMAPEYILGRGVDPRVDIYAAGVLLYLLLCGSAPFRGNTQAIMAQQISVKPEPPSRRNPAAEISPALEQVILRALAKDPAVRFATAAELKVAMEKALRGVLDEGFELDVGPEDGGEVVQIEEATRERVVVLVSACASYGAKEELFERATELGRAYGATVVREKEVIHLILGFEQEGGLASVTATKCALELRAQAPRAQIGVHDAQISSRGKPGAPGFEFTLFGPGREAAASLARAAMSGHVLVSGLASRSLNTEFRLVPVKVPNHTVEPVFAVHDREERVHTPAGSPFVGREVAKRALVEAAVQATTGQVYAIIADEGLGKSRLVQEVASKVGRLDVHWCVVAATGQGEIGTSHPASLLAALGWGIDEGSNSTTHRYMVHLMLGRGDQPMEDLHGERRMLRLVAAAISGLQQRLRYEPVVVVFDELHLADDLTWAIAQRVVETAPALKANVVLCLRDEMSLPFSLPEATRRIPLEPLSDSEALTWLRSVAGQVVSAATLFAATGVGRGNPLLVNEISWVLRRGPTGGLEDLRRLTTGEALDRLIEGRFSELSAEAQRVARAAAVLGIEPNHGLVLEVAGIDPLEGLPALIELESLAVLQRTTGGRIRFASDRTMAVVRSLTPEGDREKLHLQAARLLEEAGPGPMQQTEVGEHLLRAGRYERAFEVLARAGILVQEDGQHRLAERTLSLAVEAGQRLGPEHAAARTRVIRDLGRLLIQLGQVGRAEEVLRQGFHEAKTVKVPTIGSDILRLHGRVLLLAGDLARGRSEIEATYEFAVRRGAYNVAAQACLDLAEAAERTGDDELATRSLQKGLKLVEGRDTRDTAKVWIQLYNRLAKLQLRSNEPTKAIALFAQALDLAEQCKDHYQAAGLLGNLGGAYVRIKDTPKAIHYIERALRASENLGDQIGISRQSYNLALLRLSTGQTDMAHRLLRSSFDAASRAGWQEGLSMSRAAMAKLGLRV